MGIFRVRGLRTLFIIIILLVPVTLWLNLRSVAAMTVTNFSLSCPPKARVGDTLDISFSGSYETEVKMELEVELIQQSDNQHIGTSSVYVVEHNALAGVTLSGQFARSGHIQAPTPPSWNGDQYEWVLEGDLSDLMTNTPLGTAQCSIIIIKADAEPSVKITRASLESCPPDEMNEMYVGESCTLGVYYDYSAPVGSNYWFRYQNSLGTYSPYDHPGEDGWVEQTLYLHGTSGSTDSSGSDYVEVAVLAPLDPTSNWLWDLELHVGAPDGRNASDATSLNMTVLDREQNWAAFRDVSYPPSMSQNAPGQVVLTGVYVFPAGNTGTLAMGITYESGTAIDGGENQTIGPYSGSGIFSQTFTITPAGSLSGGVTLYATLWVSDISRWVDFRYINFVIGGSPSTECNITSVEVNGGTPPQVIPHGEPFKVDVDVSWTLPKDTKIEAEIWDWDRTVRVIGTNDLTVTADGAGSGVISVQVPAIAIPARGGNWTLRAHIDFYVTNNPTSTPGDRIFNVTLSGGTTTPAGGGSSDWAIVETSLSPVEPFLGTVVTFAARIDVTTSDPLPQTVTVSYSLDGGDPVKDSVTYQHSLTFLRVSSHPWTPTLGEHTISWAVDPDQQYVDHNRENNVMNSTFTVSEAPPQPPPSQPPQAGEEFDFYVTAAPTEQTIHSPVTYVVIVNVTAGTPQPVQLDLIGAPAGVSYFFSPTSGTPAYTSTLTITTPANLPAGTYPLTINASSVGKARYKALLLNVEKGPDYALSVTPGSVQAKPGDKAEFKVTLSSDSGYDQFVNLMVSGLPAGATSQFQPNAAIPTSQSTLSVDLGEDVAPGFYRMTIIGSGPEGKRATATLQVQGEVGAAQRRETTVNYLAAAILGLIVAMVVVGGVLAVRRLKTGQSRVFCTGCGTKIRPNLEYCPKCGAKQGRRTQG